MNLRKSAIFGVISGLVTLMVLDTPDRMYAPGWCPSLDSRDPRCLFSSDYEEARTKFVDRVRHLREKNANVELISKRIGHQLFIDFAILRPESENATDKVVIHSAGVHGIEGFAGAAVQLEILSKIATEEISVPDDTTLVFIFPVNPYGMKHKRRFNEENVDLNRNALTSFPGESHIPAYIKEIQPVLISPINPVGIIDSMRFWSRAIWRLFTRGITACKAAVVSGQYDQPDGLFYGGRELQASVKVVDAVLADLGAFEKATVWVDVHTGLGPFGEDSLLVADDVDGKKVQAVFTENNVEYPEKPGIAQYGYDYMKGSLASYFKKKSAKGMTFITQEFGTYNVIFNFRALMLENSAYQTDINAQPYFAQNYLEVAFNPPSAMWRKEVVTKGAELFARILQERHLL